MNTNGIFIKGCFIGEPFNAVLLWEFRRELRLWGDDFDAVTEELESIFDHFVEVYAQA